MEQRRIWMRGRRTAQGQSYTRSVLSHYDQSGIKLLPVQAGGKAPFAGYSCRRPFHDVEEVLEFLDMHPDANFGAVTGAISNLVVLDVDGEEGRTSLSRLVDEFGKFTQTTLVKSARDGRHFYFQHPGGHVPNSVRRLGPGLDIKADFAHVVIPGSRGSSGGEYMFTERRGLHQAGVGSAPDWLLQLIDPERRGHQNRLERLSTYSADGRSYGRAVLDDEAGKVRDCVEGSRNDGANRSAFRVGQLIPGGHLTRGEAEVSLIHAAEAAGLSEEESRKTVRSGLNAGEAHPRTISLRPAATTLHSPSGKDPLAERYATLDLTDIGNAKRFADRFGPEIANASGSWLRYDGKRWRPGADAEVLGSAIKSMEAIHNEAAFRTDEAAKRATLDHAKRSSSRAAVEAVLRLSQPMLHQDPSTFDRDPMLLNVRNGTIDLRSGDLRPHDSRDCITKISDVVYDPEATCRRFRRLIHWMVDGDKVFLRFLRAAFGYSLTGHTREQAMFFIIGPGGTGKSLLMNVLRELGGDYAIQAGMATFLVKQYDNGIPEDVARLRARRIVIAAEANIDRQIDEAKIKTLTGEDPVVARLLRQNSIQFQPEMKLWLVANNFPRVRENGRAFWRRIRVIPIERVVPELDMQRDLIDELRSELPGILAWAVRGCRDWQAHGLIVPDRVAAATERWRGFSDVIARFLKERCILDPQATVQASVLYDAYSQWCHQQGEQPQSIGGFKVKLEERDLNNRRLNSGIFWSGIRLAKALP